jgi:hypothetical protein
MEATIPAAATQADIDRLADHYTFRDAEAVVGFVRDHPAVVSPLLEAVEVVPRYFGPGKELVLEVERDRDTRDHRQLFALVQTDQDVDAALASLDRFEWEWWLDALPRAAPHLIYHIEFV